MGWDGMDLLVVVLKACGRVVFVGWDGWGCSYWLLVVVHVFDLCLLGCFYLLFFW